MIEIITKALPVVITFAAAAAFIRLCYKANKKYQAGEQYWLKPKFRKQWNEVWEKDFDPLYEGELGNIYNND